MVALQGGDPQTLSLWRQLVEESIRHMEEVYARLGVLLTTDGTSGVSFYNPMLPVVVDEELDAAGLTSVD